MSLLINKKYNVMSKFVKEIFFGYLPIVVLIQFTFDYIFKHCCIDLEYYFLLNCLSISLLSIESVLFLNKFLNNSTSHTIKRFNIKKSIYLSSLVFISFFIMAFLNYLGLKKYENEFYIVTIVFSLSFFILRLTELKFSHNQKQFDDDLIE